MNAWMKVIAAFLFGALILATSACSLRYDFTECESDGDCARIEQPAAGEFYQCVDSECVLTPEVQCRVDSDCGNQQECAAGACQAITEPDAGDASDASDTADSADGSDASDVDELSCETTQECIDNFGESFYCAPEGKCVDTTHPHCDSVYYADSSRDDVILLGSIIPTEGAAYEGIGTTIRNGVRMALIEYSSNAFSLPGGQTVAHLQCQGGSAQRAEESAQHMKDIGVPIIVGPLTSSNYLQVVRNVSAVDDDNDGVFDDPMGAIAIGATSPAIANLDAAGKHAFQIIAPDRFQTSAAVDRTKLLRARSCLAAGEDTECTDDTTCQEAFGDEYVYDGESTEKPCIDSNPQVAVFVKDDQYGHDFQSLLISRFSDRYADATVEFYEYADPADLDFDPTRIQAEFGNVISASLGGPNALPTADIVLFVGTGEAASLAKGYIAALSNNTPIPPSSKRYIVSHGAAADLPNIFAGDDGLNDALIPNVEAVTPNIFNGRYYEKWQQRYSITFSAPAQTSVGGLAYDGAYMALFAMAGVPAGEEVNGTNVTAVISEGRLQNADAGNEIILEDNTSFPGEARSALRDDEDIDMVGVSGALDFAFEEGDNKGTIRSNYLGLDVNARQTAGGDTVYEVVPTRLYLLSEDQNDGTWMPMPPSSQ